MRMTKVLACGILGAAVVQARSQSCPSGGCNHDDASLVALLRDHRLRVPADAPELEEKEQVISHYYQTFNIRPFNFSKIEEEWEQLMCEDVQLYTNLVGDWEPRSNVIEYLSASFFEVNGGVFSFKERRVNDKGIRWNQDGLVASFTEGSSAYFFLPGGIVIPIPFFNEVKIAFKGSCIYQINDTVSDPTAALAKVGVPAESSTYICQVIEETCGPVRCAAPSGACHEELKIPFNTTEECRSYYDSLPYRCASDDDTSRGNSQSCRLLHRHLAGIAEEQALHHCSHVGPESDRKCDISDCPKALYCRDPQCIIRGYCTQDSNFVMSCNWNYSPGAILVNSAELLQHVWLGLQAIIAYTFFR